MSSLEMLMNLAESLDSIPSYYTDDFGLVLNPYQIQKYQSPRLLSLPLVLRSCLDEDRKLKPTRRRKATSNIGKDGFQVSMDVEQFKPSELTVKVVDNCVVVEGKHEEREDDHGYISRHFVRRYTLPKNYDSDKVVSTLSSDGVLTISVPKPAIEDKPAEKIIQIQQTGPAHLNVKENAQEQSKNSGSVKDKSAKK